MIIVALLLLLFIFAFVFIAFPLVVLINKVVGTAFEAESESLKARLSVIGPRFAEDGVRVRKSAVSLLSVGMSWVSADLRADDAALYVMQYHQFPFLFGRVTQPTITVVGRDYTGPVVGMRLTMTEHPRLDADAVVAKCEYRLGGMTLRFRSKNPPALLEALHAIYS